MIELRDIQGLDDAKRVFQQLPVDLARKVLRGAMLDGAEVIRREAQSRAPVRAEAGAKRLSGRKGRLPGFLKASILKRARARPRRRDLTVSVGWSKEAFYGRFIEFGTRFMAARPFLRPAFDAKGAEAARTIAARLGPQIVNLAKRLRRRVARRGG